MVCLFVQFEDRTINNILNWLICLFVQFEDRPINNILNLLVCLFLKFEECAPVIKGTSSDGRFPQRFCSELHYTPFHIHIYIFSFTYTYTYIYTYLYLHIFMLIHILILEEKIPVIHNGINRHGDRVPC